MRYCFFRDYKVTYEKLRKERQERESKEQKEQLDQLRSDQVTSQAEAADSPLMGFFSPAQSDRLFLTPGGAQEEENQENSEEGGLSRPPEAFAHVSLKVLSALFQTKKRNKNTSRSNGFWTVKR